MKRGFLKTKTDANRCYCKGCQGRGRKNAPAHEGQCRNDRQTGFQYGPYCKRCYRNHLCERCMATKNATRDAPKDAHAYDLSICKDAKPEEQHWKTFSKKCFFYFQLDVPIRANNLTKRCRRMNLSGQVPFLFMNGKWTSQVF